MGLFRRDTNGSGPPQPPAATNGHLESAGANTPAVSIRELEQLVVEGMREVTIRREILELLQVGLPYLVERNCSEAAVISGQTAARLGYLAREAEFALFDGELEVDEELIQTLGDRLDAADADGSSAWDALAEVAAAMASAESLDPSPADGGPTWTLPGLGGNDRITLRNNLVARMRASDVQTHELKRTWSYGYFLGVLDELCDD
jgi:hypothetical protein